LASPVHRGTKNVHTSERKDMEEHSCDMRVCDSMRRGAGLKIEWEVDTMTIEKRRSAGRNEEISWRGETQTEVGLRILSYTSETKQALLGGKNKNRLRSMSRGRRSYS